MSATSEGEAEGGSTEAGPRAALVVAHPGHELRVHGWLEEQRPRVFVLTDGSGHGDRGRLESTATVVSAASALRGSIFGRWTDRRAYRLVLDGRVEELAALVDELAEQFEGYRVEQVVSDAAEGFNPVHDLCWVLTRCAVEKCARARGGRGPEHRIFPLEAAPDANPSAMGTGGTVRKRLDDGAWERKLEAARAYAEMREEVERATRNHGTDAFRTEVLVPSPSFAELADQVGQKPSYEVHGEKRVREGVYGEVLRFRQHFLPLADALWQMARRPPEPGGEGLASGGPTPTFDR